MSSPVCCAFSFSILKEVRSQPIIFIFFFILFCPVLPCSDFSRLKRSVLQHPLQPLPLTLSWLLRTVLTTWSAPSVSTLNQQIERNRCRELVERAKAQPFQPVKNSFSNYVLFQPHEDEDKEEEDSERETRGEYSEYMEEGLDLQNCSRVKPRPVVMTWKQREKENTKLTAELVEQKRKSVHIQNGGGESRRLFSGDVYQNINNNIMDENEYKNHSNEGEDGGDDDNYGGDKINSDKRGVPVEKSDVKSGRSRKRKGIMFQNAGFAASPLGGESPLAIKSSRYSPPPQRKSRRVALGRDRQKDTFSMPPGESQVWCNVRSVVCTVLCALCHVRSDMNVGWVLWRLSLQLVSSTRSCTNSLRLNIL